MSNSRLLKAAITLTNSATNRIKYLLSQTKDPPALGIALSTKQRGCNGTTYIMNYTQGESQQSHTHVNHDGINIYIHSKALLSIIGTEMDYVEDELKSEFVFNNPNAKDLCGCGESFQT